MKKVTAFALIIIAVFGGYMLGSLEAPESEEELADDEPVKEIDLSLQDGDRFDFSVHPNHESFDLEEKTFMAGLGVGINLELGERRYSSSYYFPEDIEIRVIDQTIIRTNHGEELNFAQLHDGSEGRSGPPYIKVVGDFFLDGDQFFVEPDKIIRNVQ